MAEVELPDWTSKLFWGLVLAFKVAILATALGVMVWYFEARVALATALLAVGLVGWAVGLGGYWWARRRLPVR